MSRRRRDSTVFVAVDVKYAEQIERAQEQREALIYDVDRPRRDPTAFADVDPKYVEQIELRQDVQRLGRAVQADPESEVARERLVEKYEEYIEVREERGAVIPTAEIQARAVDPRSVAELRALREEPVMVDGVAMMPAEARRRAGFPIFGYIAFGALVSFGLTVAKNKRRRGA